MADVTLRATHVCAGGDHVTLEVVLPNRTVTIQTEASDVLKEIDREDLLAWARVMLRMHKIGRTAAKVRADLAAGITVRS